MPKPISRGPSRRSRSLRVVEEFHDLDAESLRDNRQHPCAEAVHAGLIFLKLLVADADLNGEILECHVPFGSELAQV